MANNLLALQAKVPHFTTPLEAQDMALGVQNKLNAQQDYMTARQDDQSYRNALMRNPQGGEGLLNSLSQSGNYKAYGAVQKSGLDAQKSQADIGKTQRESEKLDIETSLKKFDIAAQIIAPVKDQASWDMARQQAAQMFGEEAALQWPEQYDPNLIEQRKMQGMAVKDQLLEKWKAMEYSTPDANSKLTAETSRQNSIRSANTTMRGQDITEKRAQASAISEGGGPSQAAFTKSFGKAPANYRWKSDGSLEFIPGGAADVKAGVLGEKRNQNQVAAINQADRIINKVNQALSKVGITTSGVGGAIADTIPLAGRITDFKNLKSDLETIKANLGFAELQAMRESSPTGGALGQIAVQELIALQSTVASLDQDQSPEQLTKRLGEIKQHYQNWKDAVNGASNSQPIIKVTNASDYANVPSGSEYITLDGTTRRKL